MLDIGFLELLLVGVVGLLVLGPERLPRAARTAGLWIGRIKRSVSGIQREITAQLEAEELRQKVKEQQTRLDDNVKRARQSVESLGDNDPQASNGDKRTEAADSTAAVPDNSQSASAQGSAPKPATDASDPTSAPDPANHAESSDRHSPASAPSTDNRDTDNRDSATR